MCEVQSHELTNSSHVHWEKSIGVFLTRDFTDSTDILSVKVYSSTHHWAVAKSYFFWDLLSIWCFPLYIVEEVQSLFSNNKAAPSFSTDVKKQEGVCCVV